MSEPVNNKLVDSIVGLLDGIMDEACGDYFDHDQADRLRAAITAHEIMHFNRQPCPRCNTKEQ